MSSSTDEPAPRPKRILVGVTGSVATIKLPLLVQELQVRGLSPPLKGGQSSRKGRGEKKTTKKITDLRQPGFEVRVVATEHANFFIKQDDFAASGTPVFVDADEWRVRLAFLFEGFLLWPTVICVPLPTDVDKNGRSRVAY